MKKIISTLLVSTFLSTVPALASEAETPLPKSLSDLGITAQDLNDTQEGIADEPTESEMDMLRHRYRRCPWGSVLQAYRIRIGRFIVVRYRCVRYRRGYPGYPRRPYPPPYRRWSEEQSKTQDQATPPEAIEVPEETVAH